MGRMQAHLALGYLNKALTRLVLDVSGWEVDMKGFERTLKHLYK